MSLNHPRDSRLAKYCKRYDYISFNLDTPIHAVQGTQEQKKDGCRFSVDTSGEIYPLDLYNAFFEIEFNVGRNDGIALTNADEVGMINKAHSLMNQLVVNFGVVNVLDSQSSNLF